MTNYINQQFERAAETLTRLGLDNPFKLEDIQVSLEMQANLEKHDAVMVITPKLDSDFTFKDLYDRYNEKFGTSSHIYTTEDGASDYSGPQEPRVSFVYMDGDGSSPEDRVGGLYGCKKTLDEQRAQLEAMSDVHAVDALEYLMLYTMHNTKPLDYRTYTRFISNPIESGLVRYGGAWAAWASGGVFGLILSAGGPFALSGSGFRVSQGLSLTPSHLETCDTSSSDSGPIFSQNVANQLRELAETVENVIEAREEELKQEIDKLRDEVGDLNEQLYAAKQEIGDLKHGKN